MKQKELSVLIRLIVVLGFICVLFLALACAPNWLARQCEQESELYLPCLIFIWATTVPAFIFMGCVWMIAVEIGRDNSFCMKNARRLRTCSLLAVLDTALYLAALIVLGLLNRLQPGVLLLIAGICAIGAAMSVCCAALSHLTCKAADMQSENDLTI